jgi:hypothetical protein
MLALQPHNMLNMLAASNPLACGFAKARLAAFAACFIVYSGIIVATVALWIWMWRDTTFQLNTIARIVALTLICSAVYLYPRLRRGFGTYCLILLASGIGLAIYCKSLSLLPGNRPQMPAIALISVGLIVYMIQTRFITGTMLLLLACLVGISFLWFNPIFFTPLILSIAGLILIFAGCILRYLVLLNSYY